MKHIQSVCKKFKIIVDDEDFAILSRHRWKVSASTRAVSMTRKHGGYMSIAYMIMGAPFGHKEIDHINGDRLDNRKENLRFCTRVQNEMNKPTSRLSSSGYKGVYRSRSGAWLARIQLKKKKIHLGTFDNKVDAARAYNEKAKELYGDFAWLNSV